MYDNDLRHERVKELLAKFGFRVISQPFVMQLVGVPTVY